MTRKVYKSAMGKPIDMGALMLQNEQIRAVGNMNINARGDVLDSQNRVIEPRNKTAQRQYRRQSSNTAPIPTTQNSKEAKNNQVESQTQDTFDDLPTDDIDFDLPGVTDAPSVSPALDQSSDAPRGGLAAAIARTREVKQELEKTQRQQQQAQGVRKI
jgi:hypothetical protein